MQCCTCSRWVHLRCLLLSFSRFRFNAPESSHSWSCPPSCVPAFPGGPTSTNICDLLFGLPELVYLNYSSVMWPTTANEALPHQRACKHRVLLPPTSPPSAPSHPFVILNVLLFLLLSLHSLTRLRFFNGMMEVFKPEATHFSTLSRFILLILSVSGDPILTHLSLFKSLYTLLYNLIALTPCLAFFSR